MHLLQNILFQGQILPPAPPPKLDAAAPQAAPVKKDPPPPPSKFQTTMQDAVMYSAGLGSVVGIGCISPSPVFMSMVTTFGLAGIVGKKLILFSVKETPEVWRY